jgi:hypothetical protein
MAKQSGKQSKDIEGIINKTADEGDHEDDAEDDNLELMFTLKITGGDPEGLKISKRNICMIKINDSEKASEDDVNSKLLEYYMAQQ